MLKRCRTCGGTVAIVRSVDDRNRMRWVIVGHGMMPCRCDKVVKMQSAVCTTLAASETAYDLLVKRWNQERGMPGEHMDTD